MQPVAILFYFRKDPVIPATVETNDINILQPDPA